jgi:hypothetical protein
MRGRMDERKRGRLFETTSTLSPLLRFSSSPLLSSHSFARSGLE